jgi:hypothetical protein
MNLTFLILPISTILILTGQFILLLKNTVLGAGFLVGQALLLGNAMASLSFLVGRGEW